MINLWFLWFLQECHRNCWELKLAHGHFRQPRLESLALGSLNFDKTVLDASVSRYWSQERACWCTGQPPLRWSVAGHDALELVLFGIGGGRPTRSPWWCPTTVASRARDGKASSSTCETSRAGNGVEFLVQRTLTGSAGDWEQSWQSIMLLTDTLRLNIISAYYPHQFNCR